MSYGHKVVDGKQVLLTQAEVTALEARDAQWVAGEPNRQKERDRVHGLRDDQGTVLLADQLANMTSEEIDTFFSTINNVIELRAVLKSVCKILAVRLTGHGLGDV